ncbi:DNA binding protein [Gordonia phage Evaa]|nr:DNA binding protein [Gordonia phage Evaa]
MTVTDEPDVDAEQALWQRRMQALTMRNAGATYARIAATLGVSIGTARKDIRLAYREVLNETPEDMLARQRSVLLDVVRVNYPAMLQQDKAATGHIMDALAHEAKLFGLYAPTRVNVGVSDVQFAEQTAELLDKLGLDVPKELAGAREPLPIDGEVVDVPPIPDAEITEEPDAARHDATDPEPDEQPSRPPGWSNL